MLPPTTMTLRVLMGDCGHPPGAGGTGLPSAEGWPFLRGPQSPWHSLEGELAWAGLLLRQHGPAAQS